MGNSLRKLFATGILFWLPILITYLVLSFLYRMLTRIVYFEPFRSLTEGMSVEVASIIAVILIIVLIVATGLLVTNYFGRNLVGWIEMTLKRLPLVSSIYTTVKNSLEMIFSEQSKSFREVVLVRFPSYESWSVGFVTNTDDKGCLTVFVPTTPNPTSGYILFVPREKAVPLDMSIDEALKFVISLGTGSNVPLSNLIPDEKRDK
tara:strand:+ start:1196 stop:1810 length:615 start_codon:yes stop_codon:yes gene_type:complete